MDFTHLPITHQAAIPESYLDDMGNMNVMWYTSLFWEGPGRFFEFIGPADSYFQTNQAGSFALEQRFRYLAEVRLGERVTVRTCLLEHSNKLRNAIHVMLKDQT